MDDPEKPAEVPPDTRTGLEIRLANLKPFPPGVSGNPSGRPKRKPITDELEKRGDQPLPETLRLLINAKMGEDVLKQGCTWNVALALRTFLDGVNGEVSSAKEIADRVEGKSLARVEMTGADSAPLIPPSLNVVFTEPQMDYDPENPDGPPSDAGKPPEQA